MIDTLNGIPFFRDDNENDPLGRLLAGGVVQGRFERLSSSLPEDKWPNEFANQSPFGEESLFAKPTPSDYFEGYVDFLPILWRIGAPMPEEENPVPSKGMLEEVKVLSVDSTSLFDYRRYSDVNKDFQNYWTYRGTDFPGQAILNKKVGYLDREKIFLSDTGRGVASFGLFVPYSNDSNVSQGRFSLDYLEAQSAIKIKFLDFDGLMIILQNLLGSKRKAYAEAIYKEVAKKFEPIALSESGLIFLYSAPVELLKYFSSKTLITLFLRLAADILNEDKELIVLKVLSAMSSQKEFDADKFLELLLTKQVYGSSLFQILYDKMRDWGGENNFSKIIIQLTKIWILSSYSDPDNKRYKDYQRLPSLVYTQKYILGFRNDNYSFEFKKNNDVLIIEGEGGIEIPGLNRYITQHPFQPIAAVELEETENEDLKLMEGVAIPAFYLKAFDDKGVWENFEKAVWLTFDIVSLYTGIGNLAKLRYLIRTEKVAVLVLRTVFGTIQVASSTLSIGLSLVENSRNRDAVNKIREYLFWLEICTLGADALSSRILAKKAGSAKEALDELRKTTKNRKTLEEIDEFSEHLDEVAGMAENLNTYLKLTVEEFETGLAKLAKIKPHEAIDYLDEALIYFNHHVVNERILQISDTNCVNVVESVDVFLRTGKIYKAAPSTYQNIAKLEQLYGKAFITYRIPTLKILMKEGERGIIYGDRGLLATGHVFNVVKIKGELRFIDGQSARVANLNDGYTSFKFLKTN